MPQKTSLLNLFLRNVLILDWYCRQRGRVLKRRAYDQYGLGSKPTRTVLLCPWERHFRHFSLLGSVGISIKLQTDSNILASPEAGLGNCLLYVLAPPSLFCRSGE